VLRSANSLSSCWLSRRPYHPGTRQPAGDASASPGWLPGGHGEVRYDLSALDGIGQLTRPTTRDISLTTAETSYRMAPSEADVTVLKSAPNRADMIVDTIYISVVRAKQATDLKMGVDFCRLMCVWA